MTKHADRDKSEQPVWPPHARAAYLDEPVPYVPAESADDERVAKYAEALENRKPTTCEHERQTYREIGVHLGCKECDARAVMAVADAEQAELRAEVERLQEDESEDPDWDARISIALMLSAAEDRAEAAEATLARVEAAMAVLDEVAYAQIATEKMLTILPTGPNRAQVPPHWQFDASNRARPFHEHLRAALDGAE